MIYLNELKNNNKIQVALKKLFFVYNLYHEKKYLWSLGVIVKKIMILAIGVITEIPEKNIVVTEFL